MIAHALLAAAIILHHDGGVIRSAPAPQEIAPKASEPAGSDERSVPGEITCSYAPLLIACGDAGGFHRDHPGDPWIGYGDAEGLQMEERR